MRRISGWRRRAALVTAVACGAMAWAGVGGGSTAVAFYHRWSLGTCTEEDGDYGLWDDAPGAGANDESAYFWVNNVFPVDETCSFEVPVPMVNSQVYPVVRVAVATNDGAGFTVEVINSLGAVIGTTPPVVANSGFQAVVVNLPPNHFVAKMRMTLTDEPDAPVTSGRSAALVTNLRQWNPGSGATAFEENFSTAG